VTLPGARLSGSPRCRPHRPNRHRGRHGRAM
jgi:hypothetical protein